MRVLIAGSVSPFSGREEIHWIPELADTLKIKGFAVDNFMLPFVNNPLLIPEQILSLRLLDVESSCDLLLTVGYPAFVLKHPHKRVLLFSLASSLHEHFGTEYGILSTSQYDRIRDAVQTAEMKCLIEAERILCASRALATRIQNQYRLPAKSLIFDNNCHDINQASLLEEGIQVVCETTLEPPDRVDLLLNALTYAREQWQLMLCVPAVSGVYYQALQQRIERLGLKERILIRNADFSPAGTKKARVFITLHFAATRIPSSVFRAIQSHIPLVTTTDCGAILEVTENQTNGLVVEPSAEEIARAVDLLVADEKLHKRLSQGHKHFHRNIVDVDKLVENLVE